MMPLPHPSHVLCVLVSLRFSCDIFSEKLIKRVNGTDALTAGTHNWMCFPSLIWDGEAFPNSLAGLLLHGFEVHCKTRDEQKNGRYVFTTTQSIGFLFGSLIDGMVCFFRPSCSVLDCYMINGQDSLTV